ncbi:MAG: phosphatase PAP2 family protein [Parvibaculaceae bacterium]|nr:phosphatase PAP2 family protein [Parvibaculaceae bacterium]
MAEAGTAYFISAFGNPVVALPAAAVLIFLLFHTRHMRVAVNYATAIVGLFISAAILKVISRCLGDSFVGTPWHLSIGAPSGHASLSTIVYGGAAAILMRAAGRLGAAGAFLLFLILLIGIAVTRVTLGTHTPMDVITGIILGMIFVVPVSIAAAREAWDVRPLNAVIVVAGMMAVAFLANVSGFRITSDIVF